MATLDPRALAWAVNRWFLVRGPAAWVIAGGCLLVLALLLMLAGSLQRHAALKARWEAHASAIPPAGSSVAEADRPPVFPAYAERFEHTQRLMEALGIDESLPGKAGFSWEHSDDPGLATQTLNLQVEASWQDMGALLDRAQTELPTAYIARLALSRERGDAVALETALQFTLVYRAPPGGEAP